MTSNAWIQLGLFVAVLVACTKPLGWYMAKVYRGELCGQDSVSGWPERVMFRLAGVDSKHEMSWREYAGAVLLFNFLGLLVVYVLQRAQAWLPLNPQSFPNVAPDLSFNTAVSFATNTNWQSYSGENTLSYLTQMLGLTVQNFLSAATGRAVVLKLALTLSLRAARHS